MNEEIKELLDEFRMRLDALEAKAAAENKSSPVAEYIDELHTELEAYYLNADSEVAHDILCVEDLEGNRNAYQYYLSADYAERAFRMKLINDMILAFKWCYDRDYVWIDNDNNYYICMDTDSHRFTVDVTGCYRSFSTVYFSDRNIASKCAKWLNAGRYSLLSLLGVIE